MEERIREAVAKALEEARTPGGVTFTVERPIDLERGDYATNAAMVAYGKFKVLMFEAINKNPDDPGPKLSNRKQLDAVSFSPTTEAKNWGTQFELANILAIKIKEELGESTSRVEVAGPGFINITLSAGEVVATMAEAAAKGPADARAMAGKEDWWGKGTELEGQRAMVEYSNPNAFKEMHVGHLIGTIVEIGR